MNLYSLIMTIIAPIIDTIDILLWCKCTHQLDVHNKQIVINN